MQRVGLLDRLIRGVNRAAEPVQNAMTPTDRGLRRGDRIAAQGDRTSGTIVGIALRVHDEQMETRFALAVPRPDGTVHRVGTQVITTPHLHWLRLGLPVPVRLDGDRGAIDWPAMAEALDLTEDELSQRPQRQAPADGIDDGCLTRAQTRLLRQEERATAVLERADHVRVLGMPTRNWDVHLRLADGTTTVLKKEGVPPYAWWLAVPGATLPVAVSPKDPTKVAVDWAALATAAAAQGRPPTLEDRPPADSLAAQLMAATPTPSTATQMGGDARDVIAANRDVATVSFALQSFVDEALAGRMKPKAFLSAIAEWEAAGMCTAEEAAAARAAAGLG